AATTATSATFNGVNNHTYSFYSVATDNVGNRQPTPASAQVSTRVVIGTPNERYVAAVYQDVLGRKADTGGLAFWKSQIDANPAARPGVAADLAHSDEYYENIIIAPAYHRYLLREPDAAGLAFWDDQMKNHGLTDERLEAGFIGSPEFFQVVGGGTNAGWVDALYNAFLGRPADSDGKKFWLA